MPFQCSYCGRRFKWSSGVRNHEDIHAVRNHQKNTGCSTLSSRMESPMSSLEKLLAAPRSKVVKNTTNKSSSLELYAQDMKEKVLKDESRITEPTDICLPSLSFDSVPSKTENVNLMTEHEIPDILADGSLISLTIEGYENHMIYDF